jgi:hypothetical protein
MNTKITALTLAAATALAFTPKPAVANDKGLAIAGGIVGGLIIAAALSDHYDADLHRTVVVDDRCDDGYWKTVEVRTWVPGYWLIERGHHGRNYRTYVEGHYECRTDRVWVAYNRYERRDDRRDDRSYGYNDNRSFNNYHR